MSVRNLSASLSLAPGAATDAGRGPNRYRGATLAVLVLATAGLNAYYLIGCGNGLSPYADAYSEANTVRAGERFALRGYAETYGLPDVAYGDRFPDEGITGPSGSVPNSTIYHGCPPASEWLGGLYTLAVGPDDLWKFRLVPTALSILAAAVFAWALIREFGAARAAFIYGSCLMAPMFTNMSHSVYYHSYAFGMLLIEISLALHLVRHPGSRPGLIAPFFLLGFAQGWFSFDYCFVVTFAPVPIALLGTPPERSVRWGAVAATVLLAGSGFFLAHLLHFAQSALYLGGIREALAEFSYRSKKHYGVPWRRSSSACFARPPPSASAAACCCWTAASTAWGSSAISRRPGTRS